MALDHLMTTGIQGADSILLQAPLVNMREVQSYYDSRANNTTKGLQSGSMLSVKKQTYLPTIGLLQFIVKKVPRRSGLFLKHEANAKTLFDTRMMVFLMHLTVSSATPKQLLSANPRQLKTEILENNLHLWRELADQLEILFSSRDDECAFIIPALDTRSHIPSIKDRRNGVGKPVIKLAPRGSGQTFALGAPDLCVPGISPEVVQHVLS